MPPPIIPAAPDPIARMTREKHLWAPDPIARMTREVTNWSAEFAVENTKNSYGTYKKQLREHCVEEGVSSFPAHPATVANFLMKLTKKGLCVSTIKLARSAINSEYKSRDDLVSPTHSAIVETTMEVVKRVAKPAGPGKLPIPVEMIAGFALDVNFSVENPPSFVEVCNVFVMILMMAGFLRESEATELEVVDVWLEHIEEDDMLYVYVGKLKTDQGRRGHTIVIGAAQHFPNICPILWFKTYTNMRPKNAAKFFCKPNGERLATTEPNKILKKLLRSRPEIDASLYGSHSLRKEGCSKAAAAGVSLTLLKRHGNWKSDAIFIYIKNSLAERLSVTQSLL